MSAGVPTQAEKKKHHLFGFFFFACSMSVSHFALCNFSRLHMLMIHNPSLGVLSMHRLSSVLILAGLSPCMPLLIALCWALCSVCYRVVGNVGIVVADLAKKSHNKKGSGAVSSEETPFTSQRQISKSNTLSLPKEIDVRKWSDKCLIFKTWLNQHIICQKKVTALE